MNNCVVKYDEGFFYVQIPFDKNHVLEDLPEKKWMANHRCWKVPASWRVKDALIKLVGGEWTKEAVTAFNAIKKPKLAPQAGEWLINNYPFAYPPFDHQKEAYLKAFNQDSFALFFEQGLGKTKTSIDLCGMWHGAGVVDTVVVVCPVSIRSVWEKEVPTHYKQEHSVQILTTKGTVKWKSSGLKVLVCGVESFSQGGAFETLIRLLPDLGKIALIVDESTRVKNHKATRTERVVQLARMCEKRLILTGTPVTQGLQDLFSQFQVLNPSTLALTSFYAFRNRYCVLQEIPGAPRGAVKIVGYKNVEELMSLIEPWSLRREKADCLDLPEKIFQTREVTMTPTQAKAYKELKKNLWTEIEKASGGKDRIEVEMILEAYMRLQQITGGHYPIITETVTPTGKIKKTSVAEPIPGANPKLQELVELLDEIPGKVVIWARFRAEIEAIASALSKHRKVVQFHGGLDADQKAESIEAFQAGDANVFVASEAAAYGLTLTSANTQIFFSQSFSLEVYLQQQDRIHRIGQTMSCTYIHLVCTGTVDEDVTTALIEKRSLADVVSDRLKNGRLDNL
jgi:SNF2 family DNA or RNA helicase